MTDYDAIIDAKVTAFFNSYMQGCLTLEEFAYYATHAGATPHDILERVKDYAEDDEIKALGLF